MIDVYCLTSPSGRRYVGIASCGISARWRSHTFDARHGSHYPLHAAIRKYGPGAFTRAGKFKYPRLRIALAWRAP